MCRLYLSINNKSNDKIDLFIDTGTNGTEDNKYEECLDGYGLVWKNDSIINSHISSRPYFEDKQFEKTIHKIENAEPNYVFGHIRKKTDNKKNTYRNNQPFIYKKENVIFLHNGEIYDFTKHRTLVLSKIDEKYRTEIKGTTDSELIMFLYLSIIDKNRDVTSLDKTKTMKRSMNELIQFFEDNNISLVANIICSINDTILICRYTVHPWKPKNCPTLYIDETKDSLLVSTQCLSHKQRNIPKNTILMR
jgi:predicted glutamine amidotransferase